MILVQGSFVPFGASGLFFLWALDPAGTSARVEAAPAIPPAIGATPSGEPLAAARLFPILRGVPHANAVTCHVHLPAEAGRWRPVKVPGVALAVSTAAQWLLDLDTAFARPGQRAGTGVALGPARSLYAWSAAAKLLMELLGRGRFVPTLRAEPGCLSAGWLLCPAPADTPRLHQLAAALPDSCRAVVPPDRHYKNYPPPAARDLVAGFLQSGAGALAQLFLATAQTPADVPRQGAFDGDATRYWLHALSGQAHRDLPPGLPGAAALHRAVDAWNAPVTGTRGHADLRTALRLNAPGGAEHGGWELELLVADQGDPPMTVPAEVAWDAAAAGGELELGTGRYRGAEQRILQDLPAMVRLFPALDPLRLDAAPARLPVAVEVVADLLRSGASALQQAGFPVLLPTGLVKPARLSTRLHLRPGSGASEGLFGLDQLVDVRWDLALGDAAITLDELRALARQKRPLIQMGDRWIQVDEQALAAALRHLEPHRERMTVRTALQLDPEIEETTAEGWVADLWVRLQEPARIEPVPVPRGFVGTLRPYQQRGLNWLAFLRRFGLGACLADDMGLGKTVQLIALLLHEREQAQSLSPAVAVGPTLLVCPLSLVGNWRRELARFAPSLRVLVHHGAGRAGAADFAVAAAAHDVVITTYTLAARDEEALTGVQWAGVVADEAQNMKNPATQHARMLRRLPAGYRIALTGTPVENQLEDLWSLFAFLNPGLLGGQEEFRRRFAIPIERYRDEEATRRLRRQVGAFVLRRTKSDPAILPDLPDKLENTVTVNLTLEQAALYEAVVQETLDRATGAQGIQRHGAVLAGLTKLKQVCNHPAAAAGDKGGLSGRSGKLDRLVEMLEEVLAEGDAALVFTQYAAFGPRLQQHLHEQLGCEVLYLDGGTPQPERESRIARFQAGAAPVFVLSLRAGGVGLNLTAAQHVFHFDRWWNPAVEDQATDRVHRIGQTAQVLVHKLVSAGTLEERIDRMLAEKRLLSDQVIGNGESWLGELSTDELRALITLERE